MFINWILSICLSLVLWMKSQLWPVIHSIASLSKRHWSTRRKWLKWRVKKTKTMCLSLTGYPLALSGTSPVEKATCLLSPLAASSLHQIVSCPFKVDAEMPSVPGRPGTSSLPTWPPRRLCHWRRTAAAGIAASPPPAAPPETPPAASAGPAALVGSPRTARKEFRHI